MKARMLSYDASNWSTNLQPVKLEMSKAMNKGRERIIKNISAVLRKALRLPACFSKIVSSINLVTSLAKHTVCPLIRAILMIFTILSCFISHIVSSSERIVVKIYIPVEWRIGRIWGLIWTESLIEREMPLGSFRAICQGPLCCDHSYLGH